MHDTALHHQDHPVVGPFPEYGIPAAMKFVGTCFPNPTPDVADILVTALQISQSDAESPMGRTLKGFIRNNPHHYGAERSSAWVNALSRTIPDPKERILVYLRQFPGAVTLHQREAMKRFMLKRMATEIRAFLDDDVRATIQMAADEVLLAQFGSSNRLNANRPAEHAVHSRTRSPWYFS